MSDERLYSVALTTRGDNVFAYVLAVDGLEANAVAGRLWGERVVAVEDVTDVYTPGLTARRADGSTVRLSANVANLTTEQRRARNARIVSMIDNGHTQREVADATHCSVTRVAQIYKSAKGLADRKSKFGKPKFRRYPSGRCELWFSKTTFAWWCYHCDGGAAPWKKRRMSNTWGSNPEAEWAKHEKLPRHHKAIGLITPERFVHAAMVTELTQKQKALEAAKAKRKTAHK